MSPIETRLPSPVRPLIAAALIVLFAGCASGSATQREKVPEPPRADVTENELPEELRELIRTRMGQHGAEMTFLMANVILLNDAAAQTLAEDIAATPRLSGPSVAGEDSANARIPARFFELQEQLTTRSRAVAEAAKRHDTAALAKRFGELGETCVACHALYLRADTMWKDQAPPID